MEYTDADLITQANVIKNETATNANTPTRVGQMLLNLISSKPNKKDGGVLTMMGFWNGASNVLPTAVGSGDAGLILTGNMFVASSSSTSLHGPDGGPILALTILIAVNDNPMDISGYIFVPTITA